MTILVIWWKIKYLYGRAQKEINSSNDKINKHVVQAVINDLLTVPTLQIRPAIKSFISFC